MAGALAFDGDRGGYPVWSGGLAVERSHARGGDECRWPSSDQIPDQIPNQVGLRTAEAGPVQVRFVGRRRTDAPKEDDGAVEQEAGPRASEIDARRRVLRAVERREIPLAGLAQVHSDKVLDAREGLVGEGDGLLTRTPGLVLSVVTADCVPVILTGPAAGADDSGSDSAWAVAAVHAGWRGIVAGVVPRALDALAARGLPPTAVAAWIGPAIGACCYEVSEDVAVRVASVSGPECVLPRPDGGADQGEHRPHLDLVAAVRHQLVAAGVPAPRVVLRCTRCDASTLWSYRRDGKAAGRNLGLVWIEPAGVRPDGSAPCD